MSENEDEEITLESAVTKKSYAVMSGLETIITKSPPKELAARDVRDRFRRPKEPLSTISTQCTTEEPSSQLPDCFNPDKAPEGFDRERGEWILSDEPVPIPPSEQDFLVRKRKVKQVRIRNPRFAKFELSNHNSLTTFKLNVIDQFN